MRDSIDFSKMERITPREDSWDKVCARLDKAEKERTLKFSFFSNDDLAEVRRLFDAAEATVQNDPKRLARAERAAAERSVRGLPQ